jgi:hypothetical protein
LGDCLLLELMVGAGESPAVLAQVLLPRGSDEQLEEAVRLFAVAVELPAACAGTKPRTAHAFHCFEKAGDLPGLHALGERDEHRPLAGCRVEQQVRYGPIDGRAPVETSKLDHRPANDGDRSGREKQRRRDQRDNEPGPLGE